MCTGLGRVEGGGAGEKRCVTKVIGGGVEFGDWGLNCDGIQS